MTPHEFHGAPHDGCRTYRIAMSERCFRFKPDALANHAPPRPGVYEFVAFDEKGEGRLVFVGLALETTVHDALAAHLENRLAPTAELLFKKWPNQVYFDFVAGSDGKSPEDLMDIAGALIAKNKPELNDPDKVPTSGRFTHVDLQEVAIV